jgi:hypothetical protein
VARKLVVEIIGDSKSLERSFARSSHASKTFERNIGRTARGALVGTGALTGLGRAASFASGAFIGGAGLTFALTSTVKAALESQRVLAQTKNALEQGGDAWKEYGKQIDAAATAQSQLSGFDDERLLQTFQNLYRATGNVNEALRLNALSANVARGRNIELEAAAQIVTKASIGQVGALRRLGIDINKNATATQALDLLQRKYAGSAATYGKTASGAFDRLKVSIENTQEIVGKALLPGLTKVTNQLNKWLANPANQQKIQDDTEKTTVAVGRLVKAFGILNRGGQAIETGLKGMFVTPLEKFVPLHVKFQQLRDDLAGINREAIAVGLSFAAASKEALTLKSAQRNDGGGGGAGNKSLIPAHVSGTAGRTPGDLGASLPFREFQLAMAAATRSRRDDEQVLRVIVATLRQRLGRAKSLKAKSEIQDALNQYQDQLNPARRRRDRCA